MNIVFFYTIMADSVDDGVDTSYSFINIEDGINRKEGRRVHEDETLRNRVEGRNDGRIGVGIV